MLRICFSICEIVSKYNHIEQCLSIVDMHACMCVHVGAFHQYTFS